VPQKSNCVHATITATEEFMALQTRHRLLDPRPHLVVVFVKNLLVLREPLLGGLDEGNFTVRIRPVRFVGAEVFPLEMGKGVQLLKN
jgi:hypothetical protein